MMRSVDPRGLGEWRIDHDDVHGPVASFVVAS
jgi:hypothetical protein